jgi:hypothetical protein
MSVQNVYHRTRDRIFKMNFSADGETSWSFTSESDGEIYAVESNNIAGYTINEEPVTLPYTITAGSSYAVSVTKTTEGKTADITLKTRRAVKKTTTLNIPDFGDYPSNGYLYVLLSNSVKIYDTSLLTSSNYSASGTWNTAPVVSTINLPTLYNEYAITWGAMVFDQGDMICFGSTYPNKDTKNKYSHVTCRVKPNGQVFNYDETTENDVSFLFSHSSVLYEIRSVVNDYVGGNYIVALTTYGNQASFLQKIKKTDLSIESMGLFNVSYFPYNLAYNPVKRFIPYVGDIDIETKSYKNLLFANNITGYSAYSNSLGRTIKANANYYSRFYIYDEYGRVITSYRSSGDGPSGNGTPGIVFMNQTNNICLSVSLNQSAFAITDFDTLVLNKSISSITETNVGGRYITSDERSKKFFFTMTSPHEDKVLIVDPDETDIEVGYLQESEEIRCIRMNNL